MHMNERPRRTKLLKLLATESAQCSRKIYEVLIHGPQERSSLQPSDIFTADGGVHAQLFHPMYGTRMLLGDVGERQHAADLSGYWISS